MSFLSLPNEIILQIAEGLSPAQLNSLLRANRRLANLIPHVLLETLFRTCSPRLGAFALFNAAERNDWRVVKRLVDRGILAFAGPRFMKTPLWIAADMGCRDIVRLLLAREDVDPNGQGLDSRTDVNAAFNTGWSPLHLAASTGNETIVRILLSDPSIRVNAQNHRGWTPLHQAVCEGSAAVARILLSDERSDV
ncbi:unnamed protein product, partial [Tuber aestivum]